MKRVPLTVRASANAGKLALRERQLLDHDQAAELVRLYKVLANDTRLRLLHAIERAEEISVTDLAAEVGMKPQAVSNQLQRLVGRRIVASRREGSRLFYRIADPCVTGLLDDRPVGSRDVPAGGDGEAAERGRRCVRYGDKAGPGLRKEALPRYR
jgi:ArsR family transcriptional regulator, lead/cadmium/zinc/bismuth-responsive transcriptional repressor